MKNAKAMSVRAVDRAIDILECFTSEKSSLSITDIGARVRLTRPTLYRLLATLVRRGYVRRDGEPPRYRLDSAAGRLADAWAGGLDLSQIAAPALGELLERFDETVALYLRKDDARICVTEMPSRQPLSFARGIGHAEKLTRGASGLVILAYLPRAEVDTILRREKEPADARRLRRVLQQIRRCGHALSGGELIVGAQAIAAPIRDRTGGAVGSIGLFGPAARFPARRILECAEDLRRVAMGLSQTLGYRPDSGRAEATVS